MRGPKPPVKTVQIRPPTYERAMAYINAMPLKTSLTELVSLAVEEFITRNDANNQPD